MSTNKKTELQNPASVNSPLSIRELGILLVKNYGLNDGFFELMIEYQIGTGAFGPNPESTVPGAMIGVSRIGLVPVKIKGPLTIDASIENPKIQNRKKLR